MIHNVLLHCHPQRATIGIFRKCPEYTERKIPGWTRQRANKPAILSCSQTTRCVVFLCFILTTLPQAHLNMVASDY